MALVDLDAGHLFVRSTMIVADVLNKVPIMLFGLKSGNILFWISLGIWNHIFVISEVVVTDYFFLLGEGVTLLPCDGKAIIMVFILEFAACFPIAEMLAREAFYGILIVSGEGNGVLEARLQVVDLFVELDLWVDGRDIHFVGPHGVKLWS